MQIFLEAIDGKSDSIKSENSLVESIYIFHGKCILHHYRDREKREIDFIIEGYHGDLLGIEVKASTTPSLNDFKQLVSFKERIKPPHKHFIGIALYTGKHIVSFGDGLWAVPISCLY